MFKRNAFLSIEVEGLREGARRVIQIVGVICCERSKRALKKCFAAAIVPEGHGGARFRGNKDLP